MFDKYLEEIKNNNCTDAEIISIIHEVAASEVCSSIDILAEFLNKLAIITTARGYLEPLSYIISSYPRIISCWYDILVAACNNDNYIAARLAVYSNANIRADNNACLRIAAKNGYVDIVKLLIDNGANVNENRDEALRGAVENNHVAVVKYLLTVGARSGRISIGTLNALAKTGRVDMLNTLRTSRARVSIWHIIRAKWNDLIAPIVLVRT